MKHFFIIAILSVLVASCSTTRHSENNGCGSENYKYRFRARLMKVENIGIGYKLHWRRMNNHYVSYCRSVPDSLIIGEYYCI